jgi:hypothetical protein
MGGVPQPVFCFPQGIRGNGCTTDQGKVNFSVMGDLRGSPETTLTLVDREEEFKKDSEWIILSCSGWRKESGGNEVGDFLEGDCGWICAPVLHDGAEIYVYSPWWKDGHLVCDKQFNGLGYQTLDHIKLDLKENPERPDSK